MTSTACDDQFTTAPPEPKLNPRYLPRSYPEMLQDLIAMREKMGRYDSTDAKVMMALLKPAVLAAEAQLTRLTENAANRMLGR